MMTRFVLSAVCILLTLLSALASGNATAHHAQIRRATKRSMMSMSKKASKTKKKGKSSKGGPGDSNGNGGGATASCSGRRSPNCNSPNNCVTPPGSCLPGSCVNNFATLRDNTANGDNTVLCNDAPITLTEPMIFLPPTSNVKISCCDMCDFGCKLQLGKNFVLMFKQSNREGSGSFVLDGVDLDGNDFEGRAIFIRGFAVSLSNAIVAGFFAEEPVIVVEDGKLTVADTVFVDNTAAIYLRQSSGSFVRTKFLDNDSFASFTAGAVTVSDSGVTGVVVEFEDSLFSENMGAGANDVFVRNSGGTVTVRCDPATNSNSNNGTDVKIGSDIVGFNSTCTSLP